jgi:hypothetical protein
LLECVMILRLSLKNHSCRDIAFLTVEILVKISLAQLIVLV